MAVEGWSGRDVALTWGAVEIKGVREKGIALNGDAINVSSDEDDGVRKLLDVTAEDSVDITLSGVTKDHALKADYFAGTRTKAVVITYPDGSTITGSFFLANYSETGPYNDAMTFSATLNSADTFTFTPAV